MRICCICNKENSSYKCPSCKQPYCSSICCKTHKESGCEPLAPETSNTDVTKVVKQYRFPTEDTVAYEKLELLRGSEDVKNCLKNPHVRDIVSAILKDSDPAKAIGLAMTEPIFVELADACLNSVEGQDEKRPT